jgi:hypothetical protein
VLAPTAVPCAVKTTPPTTAPTPTAGAAHPTPVAQAGAVTTASPPPPPKPPRSEVLPRMAEALGVTVEDLLIVGEQKPLKKKAAKSNRPAGKVREVFDRVSKLPRRQQEHIVNWVSAYVSHYEQNR